MKVLLYFENPDLIRISGIGKAYEHQKKALTSQGISYTSDPYARDYDILHINTYGPGSKAMIRRAFGMGKKVICHAHSTEEDFRGSFIGSDLAAPFFKRHLVSLYRRADALVTPTPYAASLIRSYGLSNPVYTVSNGVDLMRFKESSGKRLRFRARYGIGEDEKVVIGVGLPIERKGIDDFIEAAVRLPEYRFIWFGGITPFLIPAKIRRLLKDPPGNLILPGYVSGDILEGAFLDADCFFFPSREETEGIAVLEALAAGQNVIVRDIPVYKGWLEDGVSCRKAADMDGFIELIRKNVTCPDRRIADRGRRVAAERSLERTGSRLKKVYEKVLEECAG